MAKALSDGKWMIPFEMTGGSGRAQLSNPALVYVYDGKMTAILEWSSPYYDYMEVEGGEYSPINTEGNSEFGVVIPGLDMDIPIKARTTAMSEPHMIDYTLHFNSDAATKAGHGIFHSATSEFVCVGVLLVLFSITAAMRKRMKNGKL